MTRFSNAEKPALLESGTNPLLKLVQSLARGPEIDNSQENRHRIGLGPTPVREMSDNLKQANPVSNLLAASPTAATRRVGSIPLPFAELVGRGG